MIIINLTYILLYKTYYKTKLFCNLNSISPTLSIMKCLYVRIKYKNIV